MSFETKETVLGRVRQSGEWIEYRGMLKIEESGKNPVSLELVFVPPHPFLLNMPERHSIHAGSIAEAYAKLARFFGEHGIDLDC